MGRERGGHGPENCSQAPAPVRVGWLAGTPLSLSLVLQAKERDVEMHSCLLSNPPFFSSTATIAYSLRVNTSLSCTKKTHLQVFLIFDYASLSGPYDSSLDFTVPVFLFYHTFALLLLLSSSHCTRVCFACTEHNAEIYAISVPPRHTRILS